MTTSGTTIAALPRPGRSSSALTGSPFSPKSAMKTVESSTTITSTTYGDGAVITHCFRDLVPFHPCPEAARRGARRNLRTAPAGNASRSAWHESHRRSTLGELHRRVHEPAHPVLQSHSSIVTGAPREFVRARLFSFAAAVSGQGLEKTRVERTQRSRPAGVATVVFRCSDDDGAMRVVGAVDFELTLVGFAATEHRHCLRGRCSVSPTTDQFSRAVYSTVRQNANMARANEGTDLIKAHDDAMSRSILLSVLATTIMAPRG